MKQLIDKSEWKSVKFGDVIQSVTNRIDNPMESKVERYVGLEHLDPESMNITRWGTPDQVEATKLHFLPGDVIFGKRRAYQKKVSMADFEGICSAHALVLRSKPGKIDPRYLPVFLSSPNFLERAIKISVGSLSPTINWKTLADQEFLLPTLEQQVEIADLFWKIEEHLISIRKMIGSFERYLGTYLDNLRNERFLDKNAGSFEVVELFEVADLNWGDMQITKSSYRPTGFVAYSAAGPDGFRDKFDYDREGIVLSAIGAESGKTWLASGKWSCIKNTMRIFTLDEKRLSLEYLYWITNSKALWPKRGSAQPFISQEDARKMKLSIPDINFQLQAISHIKRIVEAKTALSSEHSSLTQLKTRSQIQLLTGDGLER